MKPLTQAQIKRMVTTAPKNEFHRLAGRLLKEVAALTSLGSADLRHNQGGFAVYGEITLHTDLVYIQISLGCTRDLGVLVRTCKGRQDYTGGINRWFSFNRLVETGAAGLAAYATQLVASEQARITREETAVQS